MDESRTNAAPRNASHWPYCQAFIRARWTLAVGPSCKITRLPASRSAACAPDRRRLTATRLQKHAGCGPGRLGRRARRRRAAATREAAARGGALPPRLRAAQRGCAHCCASCGTPAPRRRVPSPQRDAVCWACAAGSVPLRDTRTAAAPQCAAHSEPQTRSTLPAQPRGCGHVWWARAWLRREGAARLVADRAPDKRRAAPQDLHGLSPSQPRRTGGQVPATSPHSAQTPRALRTTRPASSSRCLRRRSRQPRRSARSRFLR
jgi:hypothetical protein